MPSRWAATRMSTDDTGAHEAGPPARVLAAWSQARAEPAGMTDVAEERPDANRCSIISSPAMTEGPSWANDVARQAGRRRRTGPAGRPTGSGLRARRGPHRAA